MKPFIPNTERREVRTITSPVSVHAEKRTVSGYFALFNSRSLDLGGFTEVIAPGAFTRTLQNSPDVLALVDHDMRRMLGRTSSGTLQIQEDERGLAFSVSLPDTSYANDLRVLMERNDVNACSFGFVCEADDWTDGSDGTVVRTVKQVRLIEGSIVATPAYPSTTAQLRSLFPDGVPEEVAKHQKAATEEDHQEEAGPASDVISGEERTILLLQLELASL